MPLFKGLFIFYSIQWYSPQHDSLTRLISLSLLTLANKPLNLFSRGYFHGVRQLFSERRLVCEGELCFFSVDPGKPPNLNLLKVFAGLKSAWIQVQICNTILC